MKATLHASADPHTHTDAHTSLFCVLFGHGETKDEILHDKGNMKGNDGRRREIEHWFQKIYIFPHKFSFFFCLRFSTFSPLILKETFDALLHKRLRQMSSSCFLPNVPGEDGERQQRTRGMMESEK